jgi:hypothetical protein
MADYTGRMKEQKKHMTISFCHTGVKLTQNEIGCGDVD